MELAVLADVSIDNTEAERASSLHGRCSVDETSNSKHRDRGEHRVDGVHTGVRIRRRLGIDASARDGAQLLRVRVADVVRIGHR